MTAPLLSDEESKSYCHLIIGFKAGFLSLASATSMWDTVYEMFHL